MPFELSPVSWLDISVFLAFLAYHLLLRIGPFRTIATALQAVPHLLFVLPLQLVYTRYISSRSTPTARNTTLFQDLVIRCVRYAFKNIPTDLERVFLSRGPSLPFLRFRLFRHGYLMPAWLGGGRKRPRWQEVELNMETPIKGVLITIDSSRPPDIVLYYLHGGGFALGSVFFYLEFLLTWCSLLSTHYRNPAIFALEYTLVPEAEYPTQLHEVVAGYDYACSLSPTSEGVVAGDSAGGTLLLSLLLYLGALAPETKPIYAVLISPWISLLNPLSLRSESDYIDIPTLNNYAAQYIGTDENLRDPLCCPGDVRDMLWWRAAMPERGLSVTWGSEEVLAAGIEKWVKRMKKIEGKRQKMSTSKCEGAVHCWEVAEVYLGVRGRRMERLSRVTRELVEALEGWEPEEDML